MDKVNLYIKFTELVAYLLAVTAVLCLGIGPAWALPVNINIDPTRTYLNLEGDDAPVLRLADYGISPGDTILFETFGYFLMYPGDPGMNTNMGAVFSSSDILEPAQYYVDKVNRVPGALDAGVDMITDAPGYIPWYFDIAEDFRIDPSLIIQVPTDAQYLFVAAVDAYFWDNSLPPNGSFSVQISKVPEPATLSLLGIGLAALGLLGRKRMRG